MLETMQPDKVVAALADVERLELSRMITNMQLNNVIQKSLSNQTNNSTD